MVRNQKLIRLFAIWIVLHASCSVYAEHSESRFRPLQRLRGALALRGTDLAIDSGGGKVLCQSTPVAKKELGNDRCRVAFLTAAHCVDNPFRSIEIAGVGIIPLSQMTVRIPREYFETGGSRSNEAHSGDSATLIFDIDCDKVEQVIPIPLAKVGSDGITQINTRNVYLQKRQEQTSGNRGEGAQIIANVLETRGRMFSFFAPSPQGYAIVGGDSGGPVFNERGELVCPISGSSYEFKRQEGLLRRLPTGPDSLLDPFSVSCDKRAIGRLRADLEKFGLSPVSSVESNEIADGAASPRPLADASPKSGNNSPLQGGLGNLGSGSGLGLGFDSENSHGGGGCEGGVCPAPLEGNSAGATPRASDAIPGLSQRPQAPPETASTKGPGFKEVGPARAQDLERLFSEAKAKGYKHIIVRYGNDRTCSACRNLKAELASEFGNMDDVLVIKVEGFAPIQGQGIPQSELHSLSTDGAFKQVGPTRVGSGQGKRYKQQVEEIKAREPKGPSKNPAPPQEPAPQEPAPRRTPPSPPSPPPAQPQPSVPESEKPQAHGGSSSSSNREERGAAPEDDSDLIEAPESPRNVFNGFKFEGNERGGLHFLKPGEAPSQENAIFLKRLPNGTRQAVKKNSEGQIEVLPEAVQDGLRQYYEANKEKIAHLSEKQRGFIDNFIKGQSVRGATPAPQQEGQPQPEPQPQRQPEPHQGESQERPQEPLDAEALKAIEFYEKGMKYPDGSPREYFPKDTFKDIPKGGTGQIILAYFGPKDRALEEAGKRHPFIDVRNYPLGSPEHRHAQLFKTQALALDGLGRKISRYEMSPREAFNHLATDKKTDEVGHLQRYLEAKKKLAGHGSANGSANGSAKDSLDDPRPDREPAQGAAPKSPQRQPDQEKPQHPPVDSQGVAAILEGKCIRCHQGQKGLDPSLKTTAGLLEQVKSATDGTLEDMAERAGISSDELKQLKDFRDSSLHSRNSNSPHSGASAGQSGPSRVGEARRREIASTSNLDACYMSDSERKARIEALPEFAVGGSPIASAVNASLSNGNAVFYDQKSVPRTWQSRERQLLTERNATNPHMYGKMGYHSDGSREFPWNKPAGTDTSGDTISSEKFFIPGESGQLASLLNRTRSNSPSYFGRSVNVNGPNLGWNFEKGATFGEVLKVNDPESGEGIPFEVRLRRKNNEGVWQMDVLRPFENSKDLLAGVRKLCIESKNPPTGCASMKWSALENPEMKVFSRDQFVNQRNLGTRLDPLKLSSTAASAINEKASLQVLPDMPADVVRALLKTTPFKSVFGKPWNEAQGGAAEGWAPTSNSSFNIVPKNYFGGLIPMNQVSCMKCHESAGRHVDNFDPPLDRAAGIVSDPSDASRSRTWYNFIPGNDGILSFHPFDAKKVAQGASATSQSFADCLKRSGLMQ